MMRVAQALEREGKRIAEERFQRERELQQREAEEDKRRKKEAFSRWGRSTVNLGRMCVHVSDILTQSRALFVSLSKILRLPGTTQLLCVLGSADSRLCRR